MSTHNTTDNTGTKNNLSAGAITCSTLGLSYGRYGFTTDNDILHRFIAWLKDQGHPFGRMLDQFGPGSREFSCCWQYIAENDPDEFDTLQHVYAQNTGWQPCCSPAGAA